MHVFPLQFVGVQVDVTSKTEGTAIGDKAGVPLLVKYDARLREKGKDNVAEITDTVQARTTGLSAQHEAFIVIGQIPCGRVVHACWKRAVGSAQTARVWRGLAVCCVCQRLRARCMYDDKCYGLCVRGSGCTAYSACVFLAFSSVLVLSKVSKGTPRRCRRRRIR